MTGSSKMVRASPIVVVLIIVVRLCLDRFCTKCRKVLEVVLVNGRWCVIRDRHRVYAQAASRRSQKDRFTIRGQEPGNSDRPLEPLVVEPCGAQALSPRKCSPVAYEFALVVGDSDSDADLHAQVARTRLSEADLGYQRVPIGFRPGGSPIAPL